MTGPNTAVALVQMPFANITRPSMGLGLLKAALTAVEIESRIFHANLDFAELLGPDIYDLLDLCRSDTLLGEWIFSRVAFPEYQPAGPELPETLPLPALCRCLGSKTQALSVLRTIRDKTESFIQQTAEKILQIGPRIVGCSSIFQQNTASLALLKKVKELRPEVVTVIGGANCEGVMGQTMVKHFDWVDFAVSGEADGSFPRFCQTVLNPVPVKNSWPPGVFHRSSSHSTSEARGTVMDLDKLPWPDYDDYFQALSSSSLRNRISFGLPVETSRGCWWGQKHHCTFCGLNGSGMAYRSKNADRVLAEFDGLSARYGCRKLMVVDNIIDLQHVQTLLPSLCDRSYEIFYETKANLKRHQVELFSRAGIHWIQPGIESMHHEVLKLMDKGTNPMTNVQLLKWTREFGVRVSWNFIVCFPGEQDSWYEEMCRWLPLISHLQPPTGMSPVRYDRFSPYHSRPQEYGIKLKPLPYYSLVYPLAEEDLSDLAYFFYDESAGEVDRPGLKRLKTILDNWKVEFWTGKGPIILSHRDCGDYLEILDTREVALCRRVNLTGFKRQVYETCETAQSLKSLQRTFGEDSGKLEVVLEELVAQKILLNLDSRYLALSVEGGLPALPARREYAGGIVLPEAEKVGR